MFHHSREKNKLIKKMVIGKVMSGNGSESEGGLYWIVIRLLLLNLSL